MAFLEFDLDDDAVANIIADYKTEDGKPLGDCTKEELGEIADALVHAAWACTALAESK